MREAGRADVATLVGLMHDFYAEAGYELVDARASAAFDELTGRPELGRVWLIEKGGGAGGLGEHAAPEANAPGEVAAPGEAVGYIVVTFVFAMEHSGLAAAVDDFYVRPQARGEGLGTAALAEIRRACEDLGVRALRVEVGADNAVAQAVYRSAGFEPLPGHELMQVTLAPSSHTT
jgi:ribosomal protein S18 acetylase RimI-like enzyme